MAKYKKGSLILDEASVGTKTAEDWKSQGFTMVEEPKALEASPVTQPAQQATQLGNTSLANVNYVNAAFTELHGRDATQTELDRFANKGVQDVYNAIKAGAPSSTGGTVVTPQVPQTDTGITADEFSPEPTAPLPLPDLIPEVDYSQEIISSAAQTIKTLDDYIREYTAPTTQTDVKKDDLTSKISDLLDETADKAEEQLSLEEQYKIPQLRQDYAELNTQIKTRLAEYQSLKTSIEGKPITMSSIIGQQGQVDKMELAEIGILQARASGLAGEIDSAQAQVDRAIDLKYSVIEQNLNIYEAQLNLIKDDLDEEQTAFANAKSAMLADERTRVAEEKETEKAVNNIAIQALANGADMGLVNKIANSTSEVGAMQTAGELLNSEGWVYVSTPAERDRLKAQGYEITQAGGRTYAREAVQGERDTKVVTAGGRSLLINTQTGDTIKDLGGAYKTGSGGTTTGIFKFSSDDNGRLLAVGFTSEEVSSIQSDLNEFGINAVVNGMPEKQANAIRNIASGVTPTQEQSQDKPKSISEGKRKVMGGVNALISDNASTDEIEEYIKLKGYTKENFTDLLSSYTPTDDKKWYEFWK